MTGKMGERDSEEEILKVFKLFDEDNTGFITFRNLKRICEELGENLSKEEIQEMIDEADKDNDGEDWELHVSLFFLARLHCTNLSYV